MDSDEETAREPIAVVLVSRRQGRDAVDSEHRVRTLQELYDLCRHAAPAQLTKVLLRGPQGEIRLDFDSFIARRR